MKLFRCEAEQPVETLRVLLKKAGIVFRVNWQPSLRHRRFAHLVRTLFASVSCSILQCVLQRYQGFSHMGECFGVARWATKLEEGVPLTEDVR